MPDSVSDSRRIRLSSSGRCKRMRVMQAINYDHDGQIYTEDIPTDETRRLWRLGLAVEAMEIEEILSNRFPFAAESEVFKQYDLQMGEYGWGHPDLIVIDGGLVWVFEIKSSREAQDNHFKQLIAYAHFIGLDEKFEGLQVQPVLYIAPRSGGLPKEYNVTVTSDAVDLMLEEAEDILAMADRQELPDRPCATPAEGTYQFCPLVTACFKGWEPVKRTQVTDKGVIALANRLKELYKVKQNMGSFKILQDELDDVQSRLQSAIEPGIGYELDDGTIIGYKVSERKNVSYAKAVKAGVDVRDASLLDAYTNTSRTVKFNINEGE